MLLANLTTPLIGLVDTAVLGHMGGTAPLAGAAIGSLILTQIYWVCGFLRMSSTGLSAQAYGRGSNVQSSKVLLQGGTVALVLAMLLWLLQVPLVQAGIFLSDASQQLQPILSAYFHTRVWGAPAALLNLVVIGWLIGRQQTRQVLYIQIVGNLLNALLDGVFVYGLEYGVTGVAAASVIAEYTMLVLGILTVRQVLPNLRWTPAWLRMRALKPLVLINNDMLIRNLALQLCLAYLTLQGARYGTHVAAVNALLMQFFALIALGLDAVAYGVEALMGEYKGRKDQRRMWLTLWRGLFWSQGLAVLYCLVFAGGFSGIVALLTDSAALREDARGYYVITLAMPLIAHVCFLLDGVFVGLTRAKAMRNSMLLSALGVYFPLCLLWLDWQNHGLWWALLAFMAARGVTLGGYAIWLLGYRRQAV